jgi:uncharacterized protein YjcR
MRTHSQIIDDAGGDEKVAEALGVPVNTVRAWKQRKRISHTRWADFTAKGWATFEEISAPIEPTSRAAAA